MSSCPEKKLLSAYVDNEITSPWLERIESHLHVCDACAKTVENYKYLRGILSEEKLSVDSPDYLERSFERLNSHRTFKRVVDSTPKKVTNVVIERLVPLMAAAAIFAFIFPVSLSSESRNSNDQTMATVSHLIAPQLPAAAGVISDGSLPHAEFASMIGNSADPKIEVSIQIDPLDDANEIEPEIIVNTNRERFYIQVMLEDTSLPMFTSANQFSYTPSLQY